MEAVARLSAVRGGYPAIGKVSRGIGNWVFEDNTESQYIVWDNGKVVKCDADSWRTGSKEVLLEAFH